jgi:hypothetical protein
LGSNGMTYGTRWALHSSVAPTGVWLVCFSKVLPGTHGRYPVLIGTPRVLTSVSQVGAGRWVVDVAGNIMQRIATGGARHVMVLEAYS